MAAMTGTDAVAGAGLGALGGGIAGGGTTASILGGGLVGLSLSAALGGGAGGAMGGALGGVIGGLLANSIFSAATCSASASSVFYPPFLKECKIEPAESLATSFIQQSPALASAVCASPQATAEVQVCFAQATAAAEAASKACLEKANELATPPGSPTPANIELATQQTNMGEIVAARTAFATCMSQSCALQAALSSGAQSSVQSAAQVNGCVLGLVGAAQTPGGAGVGQALQQIAGMASGLGGGGGGSQTGKDAKAATSGMAAAPQETEEERKAKLNKVYADAYARTKKGMGATVAVVADIPVPTTTFPETESHFVLLGQRTAANAQNSLQAIEQVASTGPQSSIRIIDPTHIQELSSGASQDLSKTYSSDGILLTDRINIYHDGNLYTLEGFNNLGISNHEGLIELPAGGRTLITVSNIDGAITTDPYGNINWLVPGNTEYIGDGYDVPGSYVSNAGLINVNTMVGIVPQYPDIHSQNSITAAAIADAPEITFTTKQGKAPLNGADVSQINADLMKITGNGVFEGIIVGDNRIFPFHFRFNAKGSTHSAYFLGNKLRRNYIIDDGKNQYSITKDPVTVWINKKEIERVFPLDRTLSPTEQALIESERRS